MLLRTPGDLLAWYQSTEFARANAAALTGLRSALSFLDPANYRGISRQPLLAGEELFPSLEDALAVYRLLEQPDAYEIVYVERAGLTTTAPTLGYDIGYWGDDHFSIICDVAVTPLWHPPSPSDFPEISRLLRTLNANLLFASLSDAHDYLNRYRQWSWAEEESEAGELAVIGVSLPEV